MKDIETILLKRDIIKINNIEKQIAYDELLCVHEYLDSLGVPREDNIDTLSIIGRIERLEYMFYKKMSDIENYYLGK